MVRKIIGSEYLKRYDNMTAEERTAYESRVGDWLSVSAQSLVKHSETFEARLQNVQQVSTGWNDTECQAFEEGAVLLSALVGTADTWLPDMLYIKSAKRAIKLMFELLRNVDANEVDVVTQQHTEQEDNAAEKPKEEPAEGTKSETQAVGGNAAEQAGETFTVEAGGAASIAPDAKSTTVTTMVPERPKHIDQYVHLLPEKTQERAAQVKDLLRELDEVRGKMNLLMDDQTAKDDDRAAWAKKATAIDNKLRQIYDELDKEWNALVKSGRVVVDDLGNARIVNEVKSDEPEEPAEKTSDDKARRRELRKWLVDTRRGNGDTREEHVRKWQENFKEFLAIEGDAAYEDEKIKAAAGHYGIGLEK